MMNHKKGQCVQSLFATSLRLYQFLLSLYSYNYPLSWDVKLCFKYTEMISRLFALFTILVLLILGILLP